MALFRKSRSDDVVAPAPEPIVNESGKKSGPTPKRRDAERARMERLHPTLSPREQRAANRVADNEKRAAAQAAVEKSPERTLLRNFIDSGWHPAEFTMPIMLVLMAMIFLTNSFPQLLIPLEIVMWVFFLTLALDIFFTWRKAKRVLQERLRVTSFRGKGYFTYTMNRMMAIRRFRNPPAAIKRGDAY